MRATRRTGPRGTVLLVALALLATSACGIKTTRYTDPDFNFAFVERIAVLPLENLTNDAQAGERATRLLITELLASRSVEVVEPGEVRAALQRLAGASITPSTEQVIALGKSLSAQAVLIGAVTQSDLSRSGTVAIPVVTIDAHLLETETGTAVWAATQTEKGAGVGAKLLGTGGEPISETTRRCVRRLVSALVR